MHTLHKPIFAYVQVKRQINANLTMMERANQTTSTITFSMNGTIRKLSVEVVVFRFIEIWWYDTSRECMQPICATLKTLARQSPFVLVPDEFSMMAVWCDSAKDRPLVTRPYAPSSSRMASVSRLLHCQYNFCA